MTLSPDAGSFRVAIAYASRFPLQPIGGKYLALSRENWDDSSRLVESEAANYSMFWCLSIAEVLRNLSEVRPFGLHELGYIIAIMLPSQLELSRECLSLVLFRLCERATWALTQRRVVFPHAM
jgi:hypothetical protein